MAETQPAQPSQLATPAKPVKRATAGFAISLVAGIIDAIVALILIAAASLIGNLTDYMPGYNFGSSITPDVIALWGGMGLILAILVIVGALLICMPGKETIGSIFVIIFSIFGLFFTAGGLIIGLILGIIGGILGFLKK